MKQTLRDFLCPQPKSKIKAGDGQSKGVYNFYTSSQIQSKFYHSATYTQPALIFGTGGMASVHYCNEPFSTSTDCLVMYGCQGAPLELIYYYLRSNMHLLQDGFKGAGLQHISKDYILNININMPAPSFQEQITHQMRLIDAMINGKKQQILSFDEAVKSRFVEMFIGKGYEEKSVRDVLDTAFWLMPATPKFVENGSIPYITSKNIKNRSIDFDNVKYITTEAYESISSNRPTQIGDILISMIGTLGQTAVIKDARRFYGQNLYLLRLNASVINTVFFCEFFNSDRAQHKLQAKRNQSTQAYLKANHVEDLLLPLPPMEIQEQFAAFVAEVDKSKFRIQKSLSTSRKLWTLARIDAIMNMDFSTQRSL